MSTLRLHSSGVNLSVVPRIAQRVVRLPSGFVVQMIQWVDRTRQRRALSELDERLLRDIGVSREEVLLEIRKAPWQE